MFRVSSLQQEKILRDSSWLSGSLALTAVINLAGTRLVTHFLPPALYGQVNLLQNLTLLLRNLFCFPILNAAQRFYPEAAREGNIGGLRRLLVRSLTRAMVPMQAILLAIGGYLCWRGQLTAWALLALAMFLLFDVCRTFEVAMFSGARRQRPAAFIAVLESLIRPLAIVAAVLLFSARLDVVLLATSAGLALVMLCIYGGGRPEGAPAAAARDPVSTPAMRRFARHLIPYAALMWITSVSDRYIIEWFSSDLASVGIYAAGYGLISQPFIMVNSAVSLTLRPVYFAQVSAQETLPARRTFRLWLLVEIVLCAVGVLLSLALRHWVVGVFLAPKYAQAAAVVPWIALGYFFYAVQQMLEQHLLAHNQVGSVLAGQATAAVASIAVTVPLVSQFGMIGAAYACPLYFLAACLVTSGLIYRNARATAPTTGPNATIPS